MLSAATSGSFSDDTTVSCVTVPPAMVAPLARLVRSRLVGIGFPVSSARIVKVTRMDAALMLVITTWAQT